MDNRNRQTFDGPLGLCVKLGAKVDDLTGLAVRLRDALTHHRIDEIWALMASHEEEVSELNQLTRLWTGIYNEADFGDDPAISAARAKVKGGIAKLQSAERVNSRLSKGFLAAINKTLNHIGVSHAPKRDIYNAKGRRGGASPSVFISRVG